jgi:ABC-type Mn2+/Zn2+ transport system ATPase subunit
VDKPPRALLRAEDLSIGYSHRALLSGISLAIGAGEFVGMVGPNGGGKTTLLRTLMGLLPAIAGTVVARRPDGGPVRFGYVIQREHLDRVFPLRALDIVLMGRYARIGWLRYPGREDRRRAQQALERVGIADLAGRSFRDLSGGQQQRVIIGRALAADPDVLVLDEPTNGMDLAGEGAVMDLLSEIHRQGMTILMVSHVLSTVLNRAGRLAFVRHDRALFRVGPVEEMLRPAVLGELYDTPVHVSRVGKHLVVLREADVTERGGVAGSDGERPAGGER